MFIDPQRASSSFRLVCVLSNKDQMQALFAVVVAFFYSMTFGVLKYKRQISAPLLFHLYKIDPTNVRTDENTVSASIK